MYIWTLGQVIISDIHVNFYIKIELLALLPKVKFSNIVYVFILYDYLGAKHGSILY